MAGALAGSALGVALVLTSADRSAENNLFLMVLSPAIGATLFYALSDAFFPEPSRVLPRDRDEKKPKDEYVRVLPLLTPTATGGVMGGLVGRF
jgi:hypothetical protein